jgi:hypothetical protein
VQLQAMWVDHLPPATASLLLLRLSKLHEVVAVLPFEPVVFHWVRRMGRAGQTQWSTAVRISP